MFVTSQNDLSTLLCLKLTLVVLRWHKLPKSSFIRSFPVLYLSLRMHLLLKFLLMDLWSCTSWRFSNFRLMLLKLSCFLFDRTSLMLSWWDSHSSLSKCLVVVTLIFLLIRMRLILLLDSVVRINA